MTFAYTTGIGVLGKTAAPCGRLRLLFTYGEKDWKTNTKQ
jgi:hypothetical protein